MPTTDAEVGCCKSAFVKPVNTNLPILALISLTVGHSGLMVTQHTGQTSALLNLTVCDDQLLDLNWSPNMAWQSAPIKTIHWGTVKYDCGVEKLCSSKHVTTGVKTLVLRVHYISLTETLHAPIIEASPDPTQQSTDQTNLLLSSLSTCANYCARTGAPRSDRGSSEVSHQSGGCEVVA